MRKQLHLWQFIQAKLQAAEPVVLLYVLESKGSSPGRQGFCMAVSETGMMHGSIGGGMMEHKLVELAKTYFGSAPQEKIYHKQVHNKTATKNQSGMICSGEQSVSMHLLNHCYLPLVDNLIDSLTQGKNCTLEINPNGINFHDKVPDNDFYFTLKSEKDFLYLEKTGFRQHLYIIGGGHCALALSKLMRELDFCIHLIDDRPQLNTILKNEFVDETTIIDDYTQTGYQIPNGKANYVVIMTFGYRTDAIAIRTLQDKKLAYLGMLGSRNKIETLLKEMSEADLLSKFKTHVRAPIGIAIKSRTPEEIAISIAAEIIQTKNKELP